VVLKPQNDHDPQLSVGGFLLVFFRIFVKTNKMKELLLLRGLPGSGKSTLAKLLGGEHIEADMYFMKDGEYHFDGSKLKIAHEWCRNQASYLILSLKNGKWILTMKWLINLVTGYIPLLLKIDMGV